MKFKRFIPSESDGSDWLEWRRKGVGASAIGALFGKCPFGTPYSVWESIKGVGKGIYFSEGMARGKYLEDRIMDEVERETGLVLERQVCLESESNPIFRCTLDGFVEGVEGNGSDSIVVEVKCYQDPDRHRLQCCVPDYHELQVQYQLMISGASRGLYVHSFNGEDIKIHEVKADLKLQGRIGRRVQKFWDKYIIGGKVPTNPKIEYVVIEDEERVRRCSRLKELHPLVKEYDALKKELGEESGGVSFVCGGVKCVASAERPVVDYKSLLALDCVQGALRRAQVKLKDYTRVVKYNRFYF